MFHVEQYLVVGTLIAEKRLSLRVLTKLGKAEKLGLPLLLPNGNRNPEAGRRIAKTWGTFHVEQIAILLGNYSNISGYSNPIPLY